MATHIAAISLTLVLFSCLGMAYFGWGRIASTILGISQKTPNSAVMTIWLGWTFMLGVLQLLNFILPINVYVGLPIFLFGIIVSTPTIVNRLRQCFSQDYPPFKLAGMGIIGLVVITWIASRAMIPPSNYDSGLYHFNTIRWIETYPTIPGLGNLHGRLAFNQSFFTYVAALNFHPFFGYGRSLANSFLLLVTISTILPTLFTVLRQPSLLTRSHPLLHTSDLFVLPIVIYLALSSEGLASPSPDLTSTLLQLAMFVMLSHSIAEWISGQKSQDYQVMVLLALATTAITIKLSNLAFSVAIICFCLLYAWQSSWSWRQVVIRMMIPMSALILIWGSRGFLLSGAPLYPSMIGYVPVDWAVPTDRVIDEGNWVFSWARQPNTHWRHVLGHWDWFVPWLKRISTLKIEVVYPASFFALFGIATISTGIFSFLRRSNRLQFLEYYIFIPPAISIVYWFFTAPDPRFSHAAFWLISVSSILLFLSSLQKNVSKQVFLVTTWIVLAISNLHFLEYASSHIGNTMISTTGWQSTKVVPLVKKITQSGLIIYKPEQNDQSWDSPLPSTPYFNNSLRLRTPGSFASGFTVKK